MIDLQKYFSNSSELQSEFPGWKFRQGQLDLAQAIASALESNRILLAEAGTGTGKTLAYLLPALLSGKKVLVSTHSKHLQDQLADRDVPALLRALNTTAQVAKLKGRQNYICVQRLNDALAQGTFLQREDIKQLKDIQIAVNKGLVNERGDMPALPEDSPVWQNATARPDQCLGQQCPEIKHCHTAKAKRNAMLADVVVVNHHLLCADIAMRKSGFADMLPECDLVVVDEAHQMAAAALGFFGDVWSSSAVLEWARTCPTVAGVHSIMGGDARAAGQAVSTAVRALLSDSPQGRWALGQMVVQSPDLTVLIDAVVDAQRAMNQILEGIKDLSPELSTLFSRGLALSETLSACADAAHQSLDGKLNLAANTVFWYERGEHSLKLNVTRLDASQQVGAMALESKKPWVFLSATFANDGTFSLAQAALGLPDAACDSAIVQSPFNYAQQGRLYIPNANHFPAPNTVDHALAVASLAAELAGVLGGRTAVLCTSRKAVARVSEAVKHSLDQWCSLMGHAPIEVLSQLEHGRTAMLAHFRSNPRAVLVGAAALWEGLDLPGSLLHAVVIDKIPFAQPDDPVLAARLKACEAAGQSPFDTLQIPEASLALKQGTGRLIRTESDWGIVALTDTRLRSAGYGRRLAAALPAFTRVDTVDALLTYCEQQLGKSTTGTL
jgi:ATP-dependent DNA helicase DinG